MLIALSKALAKRLDFSLDFLLDKKSRKKSSRLATLLSESSGVEWCWVKFDLCQKKSSKRIVVEWKSSCLATLSSKSSESMRSSVSLSGIFVMVNICDGKHFSLTYAAEIWVVEKSREKSSVKSSRLATYARLRSTTSQLWDQMLRKKSSEKSSRLARA